MTAQTQERIYLNPPKFWAATKDLTEKDVEQLMNEIMRLATERRVEELARYDFISFGHTNAA
ncbi:MAG TPA: hypothetical protein VKZ53_02790 [Candidatus Angelobacter sp.]|nr:hypothetical protein [Candidatus Angelobacter sp.]